MSKKYTHDSGSAIGAISKNFPKHSSFNFDYEITSSGMMGDLIPIEQREILPGDSINETNPIMIRLLPTIFPIFAKVCIKTFRVFVPNRIIFKDWEKFITGWDEDVVNLDGTTGGVATTVHPFLTLNEVITPGQEGFPKLADYMGIQNNLETYQTHDNINELPFRAYNKAFNDLFRDQDLIPKAPNPTGEGQGSVSNYKLLKYAWNKDRFTTARPWQQKGVAINIPLEGNMTVRTSPTNNIGGAQAPLMMKNASNGGNPGDTLIATESSTGAVTQSSGANPGFTNTLYPSNLFVNANETSGISLNDLRLGFQARLLAERDAVHGTRYVENLFAHWGVLSSDARLQRAEYIDGYETTMLISEVLQTSETAGTPLGTFGGHGIGGGLGEHSNHSFEEHGWLITFLVVVPETGYCQGKHRSLDRKSRLDYYIPELALISEQGIKNKELKLTKANGWDNEGIFGFEPPWQEYKVFHNKASSKMRDEFNFMNMIRIFDGLPKLGQDFINNDATQRIHATGSNTGDNLLIYMRLKGSFHRPMPYVSQPGLIDHVYGTDALGRGL